MDVDVLLGPFGAPRRGESNDELVEDNTECEMTALGRGALAACIGAAGLDIGGNEMTALLNDDLGSSVDVSVCSCFSCCSLRRLL